MSADVRVTNKMPQYIFHGPWNIAALIITAAVTASCSDPLYEYGYEGQKDDGLTINRYDIAHGKRYISYHGSTSYQSSPGQIEYYHRLAPSFSVDMMSPTQVTYGVSFTNESFSRERMLQELEYLETCTDRYWIIDGSREPITGTVNTIYSKLKRLGLNTDSSIVDYLINVYNIDSQTASRIFNSKSFSYAFCAEQGSARPSELEGARKVLNLVNYYAQRGSIIE